MHTVYSQSEYIVFGGQRPTPINETASAIDYGKPDHDPIDTCRIRELLPFYAVIRIQWIPLLFNFGNMNPPNGIAEPFHRPRS